ncbi:MAG: hypothetical protein HC886_16500 [Leptolyngbyaceae cyanobacterium SM1_1_3]|nr:hypothetical protein [Leptolyngbyaceae cyanobacterium SM1_1_3]
MTRESTGAERLQKVLMAAARAPGNRSRFLRAGLIDASGELVTAWQSAFHRLQPLSKAELRSQPGQFLAQATDVVFAVKPAAPRQRHLPTLLESAGIKNGSKRDSTASNSGI